MIRAHTRTRVFRSLNKLHLLWNEAQSPPPPPLSFRPSSSLTRQPAWSWPFFFFTSYRCTSSNAAVRRALPQYSHFQPLSFTPCRCFCCLLLLPYLHLQLVSSFFVSHHSSSAVTFDRLAHLQRRGAQREHTPSGADCRVLDLHVGLSPRE